MLLLLMQRSRVLMATAAWAALAVLFVLLAVFAAFFDRFPADERLAHALQDAGVPVLGGFFDFVNVLGDGWFFIPFAFLVALAFLVSRAWVESLMVLLVLVPRALNSELKELVERPRPSDDLVR